MKKIKKNSKKQAVAKTRKQLRKEKRQQKKINRAHYHNLKKTTPGQFVLNPGFTSDEKNEIVSDKNIKNSKISNQKKNKVDNKNSNNNNGMDKLQRQLMKEKKELKHLENQMKKQRKVGLIEDNDREDLIIKRLEKQLRLNKRKSKTIPKSFTDDGLDYLLDFCDGENRKIALETEKQLLGIDIESDFEQDLEAVTKGINTKITKKSSKKIDDTGSKCDDLDSDHDDADLECDDLDSDHDETDLECNDSDLESNDSNESYDECQQSKKKMKIIDENINEPQDDFDENKNNDKKLVREGKTWQDIYGRERDSLGNIIDDTNKYVPPAVRLKQMDKNSADGEKLLRLKRQLKGLINRLAEFNLHSISSQIEELYMSNSRNDMNELLSSLLMESIVTPVMTPDRLTAEHMILIAILHANVGTEVGAHFLLTLVKKIDELMKSSQDVENKELDNLILMLAHLFNFKVYGSQLIYQILDKLINKFTEKEIELILLILKTVGFQLRKDNPIALKELIIKLQLLSKSSKSSNSRIQFMFDVLLAIKNNNMHKIPQYDPTHIEHLKKLLKSFLRKGNTVTQLNISLDDLLTANEKGKWWIIGSAWTGTINNTQNDKILKPQSEYSEKLLELARKQRMNTEIRRNVFCILMTAEDYLDAFEKITRLGLKDHQQREIISVIIKCCLQEKIFNPYYAILAQRFCDTDRKYQMTLQFSLWDKLKSLNSYSNIQINNLSKFLTHLFIERGLSLSVFKVVQFGELDKPTMRLIRQIMLGILLHENTESCLQVFERIPVTPKLQTFREGLALFITHFLMKNVDNKLGTELQKLKERGELVNRILYSRTLKTIL